MENTGIRFPGNLDPSAQEFRPTYTTHLPFLLPPNIYYPYPSPPHPAAAPAPYHPTATFAPPFQPLPPPVLPPVTVNPTRALLLSSVPTDVSESTVRRELEVFGDVRAVQMERVRDGIVTVHFYDLRNAIEALTEIQVQHMQQQCRVRKHFDGLLSSLTTSGHAPPHPPPARGLISGRAVWAQFTLPVTAGLPDGNNQGTIVIFNVGHEVSGNQIREIFEAFGCVKELRETPLKRNQRFVEFYDVRNAAKALANVNGSEINGRNVVVEFSRPGGNIKRFSNSTAAHHHYHHRPPPPQTPVAYNRPCISPQMNRKPGTSSGRKGGTKTTVLEASVSGLSLRNENCNLKKSSSVVKVITKSPEVQHRGGGGSGGGNSGGGGGRSKQWKGSRQMKERYDPRFLIKEDAVFAAEPSRRDPRTTVMIKNIPNKYSQKLLLNMLDNHCIHCNEQIDDGDDQQPLSSYDFVYLPIDFINKCNVGYGFVNMTSPEATWRLYKAFHLQNWEVFNSKKICEVSYARLQGVEALKEHFKTSKFPCEAEEYMPVLFSPPRDGRRLTEPVPIIGRNPLHHHRSNSTSSSTPSSPAAINKTQEELRFIMEDSDGFFVGGSSDTTTNHNDDDDDDDCGGGSYSGGGCDD